MALSSEEHALLVQTCDSMNLSAEVNREVLELVRNLGNTGVVDIATHDNDDNAHANSSGLLHINNANVVSIGTPGYCNDKGSHANDTNTMFRLLGSAGFYPGSGAAKHGDDLFLMKSSWGGGPTSGVNSYFLETDSSGYIAAKNDGYIFSLSSYYYYLENGEIKNRRNSISFKKRVGGSLANADGSLMTFQVFNGDTTANTMIIDPTAVSPGSGVTLDLGYPGRPFNTAYFSTEPTVGSDRRVKSGISPLGSDAVDFIKALRPVQFTLKEGTQKVVEADEHGELIKTETTPGVRTHWGLIAQEVKEAMNSAGIEDAAVWCLEDKNDPDSKQSLRYGELIAPLIKAVQVLAAKVEALEGK